MEGLLGAHLTNSSGWLIFIKAKMLLQLVNFVEF